MHHRRLLRNGDPLIGARRAIQLCSVAGCKNNAKAKSYCNKHYVKFLKYGDPLGGDFIRSEVDPSQSICKIHECSDKTVSRGYCNKHYIRFSRYGDPEFTKISEQGSNPKCSVDQCEDDLYGHDLCRNHLYRESKTPSLV